MAIRRTESTDRTPDPVVDAYKRHVDRSLLRENLKLTPEERVRKLEAFVSLLHEARRAGTSRR